MMASRANKNQDGHLWMVYPPSAESPLMVSKAYFFNVELCRGVLPSGDQDRQLAAMVQGQEIGNVEDTSVQGAPDVSPFLV